MKTISHEEYLALNEVYRSGIKSMKNIPMFASLRRNLWIKAAYSYYPDEWEISSSGRLEHNLYEKIHNYSDGYKLKEKPKSGCPRCFDTEHNCPCCRGLRYGDRV